MPKNFRDAITISREPGLRYMWIDSLCIIQDSDTDWQIESSKMADIYRHGYITIAAVASPDSKGGCFPSNPIGDICLDLPLKASRKRIVEVDWTPSGLKKLYEVADGYLRLRASLIPGKIRSNCSGYVHATARGRTYMFESSRSYDRLTTYIKPACNFQDRIRSSSRQKLGSTFSRTSCSKTAHWAFLMVPSAAATFANWHLSGSCTCTT